MSEPAICDICAGPVDPGDAFIECPSCVAKSTADLARVEEGVVALTKQREELVEALREAWQTSEANFHASECDCDECKRWLKQEALLARIAKEGT